MYHKTIVTNIIQCVGVVTFKMNDSAIVDALYPVSYMQTKPHKYDIQKCINQQSMAFGM